MDFNNLQRKVCPECGASPKSEGVEVEHSYNSQPARVRQHVNGQRWEWRQFLCGARVVWVPNFEREEMDRYQTCGVSKAARALRAKREKARTILQKAIESLDVDEEWASQLQIPDAY